MEVIVGIVIGVLGLIAAGVQIYYARKPVSSPASSPSAAARVPDAAAGPECRYLVVEGYTEKTFRAEQIDVQFATLTIDGSKFQFDGGDIGPNRVFMIKGHQPGSYLFTAHFSFHKKPDYYDRNYAADILLDHSVFYMLKWEPYTSHSGPPYTRFVSVESVSEDLFRLMTAFNVAVLPSCKALKNGVTLL